jgi:hypothetical protein
VNHGWLAAGMLAGWLAAMPAVAQTTDPSRAFDFSVLTPAMEGRYFVASGVDFTAFIPPYVSWGDLGRGARNDRLRLLVAREGYKPERTIADRLIDRLAEASYRAVYEPIQRKPAGSVQSLAWDDLPAQPRGELMLDVTIHWICLCADVAFTNYYPAISIGWRVLDPARIVVQPTRTLSYHHLPPPTMNKRRAQRARQQKGPPMYPVETVTEVCGFDSVKEAEENPAVLWGCLGEAYDAALRRLVIDLKRLQPPQDPD